jgi:metallo-beta-lactamase class B
MIKYLKILIVALLTVGCKAANTAGRNKPHASATLVIQKISKHVYQHTSLLDAGSFGQVSCNGMVVFSNKEAIIFDTPADNSASLELIHWVENSLKCKVTAVIPTHFHADCLGGLDAFHQRGIPSFANQATISLAKQNNKAVPKTGFDQFLALQVGHKKVFAEFFGEGHTQDNVIGYFPAERVVFGGCLIKELGAGKGNLDDANTAAWSPTVTKLKEKYPDTKIVIPGHGKIGGTELFDYTIQLFRQK